MRSPANGPFLLRSFLTEHCPTGKALRSAAHRSQVTRSPANRRPSAKLGFRFSTFREVRESNGEPDYGPRRTFPLWQRCLAGRTGTLCALRYNGLMEYRDHSEWTPRSEAWVEAATWISEEKRARLREDPTGEAFARLAFQLCMQQTQETDDTH
jgi:hypothetical protein